jgi:dTMP kinase
MNEPAMGFLDTTVPASAICTSDELIASGPVALRSHGLPGFLLTFCGIDGSGKSSMIDVVGHYLDSLGMRAMKTYTPTPRIRKNALFRELVDASTERTRERTHVLGMGLQILGDLMQHLKDTIIPALQRGDVVLCDRYVFTTLAEVRARSDDPSIEHTLLSLSGALVRPDLAIALDVPPDLAIERVHEREAERDQPVDRDFVARQACCYLDVATENGLLIVSSSEPMQKNFLYVRSHIDACIGTGGRRVDDRSIR